METGCARIARLHAAARNGRAALAFCALALCAGEAAAPPDVRLALVIGNSAYANAPVLPNAAKDAAGIAAALQALGFRVERLGDANLVQMREAVERMQRALHRHSGVAMLYYAGHG